MVTLPLPTSSETEALGLFCANAKSVKNKPTKNRLNTNFKNVVFIRFEKFSVKRKQLNTNK
jgi:hypothetical protein